MPSSPAQASELAPRGLPYSPSPCIVRMMWEGGSQASAAFIATVPRCASRYRAVMQGPTPPTSTTTPDIDSLVCRPAAHRRRNLVKNEAIAWPPRTRTAAGRRGWLPADRSAALLPPLARGLTSTRPRAPGLAPRHSCPSSHLVSLPCAIARSAVPEPGGSRRGCCRGFDGGGPWQPLVDGLPAQLLPVFFIVFFLVFVLFFSAPPKAAAPSQPRGAPAQLEQAAHGSFRPRPAASSPR